MNDVPHPARLHDPGYSFAAGTLDMLVRWRGDGGHCPIHRTPPPCDRRADPDGRAHRARVERSPYAGDSGGSPDDGVRLTGVKTSVPCAEQASRILVPARCDDGSIGLYFVAPRSDGVTLAAQHTQDGQPHAQLELAGATVAHDARLGAHGEAADILRWLVNRATVARCMMQLDSDRARAGLCQTPS